jgi:hypothetical protein
MESIGGTRALRSDPHESDGAMRGGYLWTPVGDPRSRCGNPLSVPAKAARRFDADQLVEIEIDDCLQRRAGGAVAQRLG